MLANTESVDAQASLSDALSEMLLASVATKYSVDTVPVKLGVHTLVVSSTVVVTVVISMSTCAITSLKISWLVQRSSLPAQNIGS